MPTTSNQKSTPVDDNNTCKSDPNTDQSICVIIQAYNSEKIISKIIKQVLAQNYQPNEMILINDGSFDSTICIINNFRNRNPNFIKTIHQENGGLCSARNAGLYIATGRYVTFVDSDDWIIPDAYAETTRVNSGYLSDIIWGTNISIGLQLYVYILDRLQLPA